MSVEGGIRALERQVGPGDPIPMVGGDLASVLEALDRLRSYEEIRQLVQRYAIAIDACDVDTVGSLFADSADFGDHGRGPEAARAFYDGRRSRHSITVHNVGNHVIDFDGPDLARGVVYCRAEHETPDEWLVAMVVYRDRYERVDGRWGFAGRQPLIFHGGDMLERPNTLPPADQPEGLLLRGRGRVPSVWPSWDEFWSRHEPSH